LAGLELHYDEQWKGLRRLYRLVRNNPDEPEAYSAYLTHFLVGGVPKLTMPLQVGPGVAVSLDEETLIIDPEDITGFSKAGSFLPCDDVLMDSIAGASIGDIVNIPLLAGGTRQMKVTSIRSSYEKITEIARDKARTLGGIPNMKLLSIGDTGNPEVDLAPMLAELSTAGDQRRRLLHVYGEQPITLSMLAHAVGRTTLEIVSGWWLDGPPLIVGSGHVSEQVAARDLLNRPDALYAVDSMTLAELILFDAGEALRILPRLLITVRGKESVEALLTEDPEDKVVGTALETNGKLELIKYDEAHHSRRRSFACSMVDAVTTHCEVAPAYGEMEETQLSEALSELVEGEERELLLLAKEYGATLVTVDGRLRRIAKDALGIPSVWPQALVMGALEKGVVTQQAASRFAIGEFFANRSFVSLRAEDLLWMVAQGDAHMQQGFMLLKRYIASTETERVSILRVVLDFLLGLTSMDMQLGAFGEILFHLAEAIFRRVDSPANPKLLLVKVVNDLLQELSPEHGFSMLDVHRNRQIVLNRLYLVRKIEEAEARAKDPAGAEPVRVRVLFGAVVPSLVLDRTAKQPNEKGAAE
jgi:hypothetical protein